MRILVPVIICCINWLASKLAHLLRLRLHLHVLIWLHSPARISVLLWMHWILLHELIIHSHHWYHWIWRRILIHHLWLLNLNSLSLFVRFFQLFFILVLFLFKS